MLQFLWLWAKDQKNNRTIHEWENKKCRHSNDIVCAVGWQSTVAATHSQCFAFNFYTITSVLSECLYLNHLLFLYSSKCFVFISSWYFFMILLHYKRSKWNCGCIQFSAKEFHDRFQTYLHWIWLEINILQHSFSSFNMITKNFNTWSEKINSFNCFSLSFYLSFFLVLHRIYYKQNACNGNVNAAAVRFVKRQK